MQSFHRFIAGLALACLSVSSLAATVVYTSSAAFLSRVLPGSYTETFTGASNPSGVFTGGAFGYTATAPNGLYLSGSFLSTSLIGDSLTITFNTGNVTAFGANFFPVDLSDAFQPFTIRLALNDGTIETFTPTSFATSYRGFTSDIAFSSVVISAFAPPGNSPYPSVDNLTVGAIPEPSTVALMGLGFVVALRVARRRKA